LPLKFSQALKLKLAYRISIVSHDPSPSSCTSPTFAPNMAAGGRHKKKPKQITHLGVASQMLQIWRVRYSPSHCSITRDTSRVGHLWR
jgi:hypothetical protein